jgi:hypothetical protein
VSVEIGSPQWTTGKFRSTSAENDLGLESVGAFLLRRLLPGIVQTTEHAGYYAFYAFLLAKWEETSESVALADFIPFFRRHELAYAIACRLHQHRVPTLGGVQGSLGARRAIRDSGSEIDLAKRSKDYIDARLGGYSLFYSRMLEALRLTKPGASRVADRVTARGRALAQAFGEAFESSRYYQDYFDGDVVPAEVFRELGERVCLCTIPRRSDHQALLDVFFGEPEEELAWESLRTRRIRSLALHLAYHRDRPDAQSGGLMAFRSTIASGRFEDGTAFTVPFAEVQNAWRVYQLRECQTLVLTAIWSWYLQHLQETYPTSHAALRHELVAITNWASSDLSPAVSLQEARLRAQTLLPDGRAIVEKVTPFEQTPGEHFGAWLGEALLALLAIDHEASGDEPGLVELRGDGGSERWSLAHMHEWLALRDDHSVAGVLAELFDELRLQHLRIATPKLSPTDQRDPFCFAEDNGVLRFVRADFPFWTGARFGICNTMLWSLGLSDSPTGEARLTELGARILAQVNARA